MTEINQKKLDFVKDLNDEFFELYGDIYENRNFLTDKQKNYMQSCLFEQYKLEFEKIYYKKIQEDKFLIFNLKQRAKLKVPRIIMWIFKNKLARTLLKLLKKEAKTYRNDIKKGSIEI